MADDLLRERLQESFERKGIPDRSHSRVPVSFPIRFLPVSKEEAERLHHLYPQRPSRERTDVASYAPATAQQATPGTMSAAILAHLERIERKLDQLLGASGVAPEKEEKEQTLETGQCIDLSASGLLFSSRWAMGKGWFLKLIIDTPEPQPFSVVALGRVVRVDQEADSSLYVTACQFEAIHEEDREEIIAYIFKRHRELAQSRREQG